jgi:hypothetical protein
LHETNRVLTNIGADLEGVVGECPGCLKKPEIRSKTKMKDVKIILLIHLKQEFLAKKCEHEVLEFDPKSQLPTQCCKGARV